MTYRRRSYRPADQRPARWMELRYPGMCRAGQHKMAAGERGYYSPAARAVLSCTNLDHAESAGLTRETWQGAPGSGQWVRTLAAYPIGGVAPGMPLDQPSTATTYARFDRRGGYGRCEDAPCCGCCD